MIRRLIRELATDIAWVALVVIALWTLGAAWGIVALGYHMVTGL